jgi:hypothetical protein
MEMALYVAKIIKAGLLKGIVSYCVILIIMAFILTICILVSVLQLFSLFL